AVSDRRERAATDQNRKCSNFTAEDAEFAEDSQVIFKVSVTSGFLGAGAPGGEKPIEGRNGGRVFYFAPSSVVTRHGSLLSIGVPMFSDDAVLDAKHVEPERLMMLAILAGPRLSHINDDHVIVANHIQQLALVVRRQFLTETFAKSVHETFQPGGNVVSGIALSVIGSQKTGRGVDIATDQHCRIKITDDRLVAFGQSLVSPNRLRKNGKHESHRQ